MLEYVCMSAYLYIQFKTKETDSMIVSSPKMGELTETFRARRQQNNPGEYRARMKRNAAESSIESQTILAFRKIPAST